MEERISDIEDRNLEITQKDEDRDLNIKNDRILQELSDSMGKSNIRITGVPEEDKEKGMESLFKQTVNKTFPNLWKELHPQSKGCSSKKQTYHLITPIKKRPSSNQIVLKLSKINDK